MTDSKYTSPCPDHEPVTLYVHPQGNELICACGRAYTNPDSKMVVNGGKG